MKNLSLKKIVSASLLGIVVTPVMADIVISQYIEGGSYNKALELYNTGTQSESLGDYKLVRYQNGDASKPKNVSLDNVSLAAGAVYVIAHSSASTELLALAQQTTSSLDFNGDDPIALVRLNDASTVDFFGEYGDVNFAKDVTYNRLNTAPISDGIWNASAWSVFNKDDFTGLGEAPAGDVVPPELFSCSTKTFDPIYDIQGTGSSSPFVPDAEFIGSSVFTSGVITSIVSDLYNGFFIQDAAGDNNPLTSDGVFVFTNNIPAELAIGDEVCLYGTVREYFNATQVSLANNAYEVLSTGNTIVATRLVLDSDSLLHNQLEAYEGMLVTTNDSDLIVSRTFGFDFSSFRNNMVMTYQEPIYKSTHLFEAQTEAEETLSANNLLSTLFIETDKKPENGVVPYFANLNAEDGYIRVGDQISNLEGVINYSYNQYRLVVGDNVSLVKNDFDHSEYDRSIYGPELDQTGNLRVTSFNVLNLFNSPFGGDNNPLNSNRGAKTQEEFELQITKIATALSLIDADIVGLMEIENNGFGSNSAIATLVNTLNNTQPASALPYDYITAGDTVGGDAIAVGLLYRPGVVKPFRRAVKINMPEQHGTDIEATQFDKFQRVSLLQTFKHRKSRQKLSVVVNHFKSKGSACIEDTVAKTSQGNCNAFRVSAAVALGDYLDTNIRGNVLILGDLNAYGKEDPIRVLTDYDPILAQRKILTSEQTTLNGVALNGGSAVEVDQAYGMINVVEHFQGQKAYSYTFNGELGSLDYALVNSKLLNSVVDADDWHINAAESTLFQYSSSRTGDLLKSDNAYSSSDHDPVVIEIKFKKKKHHWPSYWWFK